MHSVAIVQARCGSSRLPNKIFAGIEGKPLIWHVINRLKYAKKVDSIVIATTENSLDNELYMWCIQNGLSVFRGSENDVLKRYHEAARFSSADIIIRVTADDPFKDPDLIDRAITSLESNQFDLVSNNYPPSYPEGLDVEVFTYDALCIAAKNSTDNFEREHVTQYFYRNPTCFKIGQITNDKDLSRLRWTIDTEADLLMVQAVYSHLYKEHGPIFYRDDILKLLERYPDIEAINSHVARSALYQNL